MIRQIQPLRFNNVMIQPLQPLGGRKPSYFNGYQNPATANYSDISDPYAVDSAVDVLLNTRAKDRLIAHETGWDLGDIPVLSYIGKTVLSGVLYIKNTYAKPLIQGDLVAVGLNSLVDFSQTMDTFANSTKALALGNDSGKTSLAVGAGMGALTAGLAAATGGASIGASLLAGMVVSGVSSVVTGVAQNPMQAQDRFVKSLGFLDGQGRTQYDFDTGNWLFNMYGEMTVDPLNWGTFGNKFLMAQTMKKGWKVPASVLSTTSILANMDDVVTTAAWSSNPLGLTLRGAKKGFTTIMRHKGAAAIRQANRILADGVKTVDDVNELQVGLQYAAREADEVRRGYAATGELNRIKGDSREISTSIANVASELKRQGVPESKVEGILQNILKSYFYGDSVTLKAKPMSLETPRLSWEYSGFALDESFKGTHYQLSDESLTGLFNSLKTDYGAYNDAFVSRITPLINAIESYSEIAVRSSDFAQRVINTGDGLHKFYASKMAELMSHPERFFGATTNMRATKAQMLQHLFLKEFKDMNKYVKVNEITGAEFLDFDSFMRKYKNTPALEVLERLSTEHGVTLKEVFEFNGRNMKIARTAEEALEMFSDPETMKSTADYLGLVKVKTVGGSTILKAVEDNLRLMRKVNTEGRRMLTGPLQDSLVEFRSLYGGRLHSLFTDISIRLKQDILNSAPNIALWTDKLTTKHTAVLGLVENFRDAVFKEGLELGDIIFKHGEDARVMATIRDLFDPHLSNLDAKDLKSFYKTIFSFIRFVEGFKLFDRNSKTFNATHDYIFDDFVTDMLRINNYDGIGDILMFVEGLPTSPTHKKLVHFLKDFALLKPKFGIEEEVAASVGLKDSTYVMRISKQMMTLQHFMNIQEDKELMKHLGDLTDPNNPIKQLLDDLANYEDNPYFNEIRSLSREILGTVEGYRNYATFVNRLTSTLEGSVKFNPNLDDLARMVHPAFVKIGANGMLEIDPTKTVGDFVIDLAALPYYKADLDYTMYKPDGTLDVSKFLHTPEQVNFLRGVYYGILEDPEIKTYLPVSKRLRSVAIDVHLGETVSVEKDLLSLRDTIKNAKEVLLDTIKSADAVSQQIEIAKLEQLLADFDSFPQSEVRTILESLVKIDPEELLAATGKTQSEFLDQIVENLEKSVDRIVEARVLAKESISEAQNIVQVDGAIKSAESLIEITKNAKELVSTYEDLFSNGRYTDAEMSVININNFLSEVDSRLLKNVKSDLSVLGVKEKSLSEFKNFTIPEGANKIFIRNKVFDNVLDFANYSVAQELGKAFKGDWRKGFKPVTAKSLTKRGLDIEKMSVADTKILKDNKTLYDLDQELESTLYKLSLGNKNAHATRVFLKGELGRISKARLEIQGKLKSYGFGTYFHNNYLIKERVELFKRVGIQEYFARNPEAMDGLLAQAPRSNPSPVLENVRMKLTTLFPERVIDLKNNVPLREHLVWDVDALNKLYVDSGYTTTQEEMLLFVQSIISHDNKHNIKNLTLAFDGPLWNANQKVFKFMSEVLDKKHPAFSDTVGIRLIGPDGLIFDGPKAFNKYRSHIQKINTLLTTKYGGDLDLLPEGHGYISYKYKGGVNQDKVIQDVYTRFVKMPHTPDSWIGKQTKNLEFLLDNGNDRVISFEGAFTGGNTPLEAATRTLNSLIAQARNNPARLIYVTSLSHNEDLIAEAISEYKKAGSLKLLDTPENKKLMEQAKEVYKSGNIPDNLIFSKRAYPERTYSFETFDQFKQRIKTKMMKEHSLQTKLDYKTGEISFSLVTHKINPTTGQSDLTRYGKLKEALDKAQSAYDELSDRSIQDYTTRNVFTTRYDTVVPTYDKRFLNLNKRAEIYFFKKHPNTKLYSFDPNGGKAAVFQANFSKDLDRYLDKFDDEYWRNAVLHKRKMDLEQTAPTLPTRSDYVLFESEEEAVRYYTSEEYGQLEVQKNIDESINQYKNDPETWLKDGTIEKISQQDFDDYINSLKPDKVTPRQALSLYKKSIKNYEKALKEYDVLLKKYQKSSAAMSDATLVSKKLEQVVFTPEEEIFLAREKATINGIRIKNKLLRESLDSYHTRIKELGGEALEDLLDDQELRIHVSNIKTNFNALNYDLAKIKRPGDVGGAKGTQAARVKLMKKREAMDAFHESIRRDPLLREREIYDLEGNTVPKLFDPSKSYPTLESMYEDEFHKQLSKIKESPASRKFKNTFRNNSSSSPSLLKDPIEKTNLSMSKVSVLNIKTAGPKVLETPGAHYIARGGQGVKASALKNPFEIDNSVGETREVVIEKYRNHLLEKLKNSESPEAKEFDEIYEQYSKGEPLHLVCFCAPAKCHGDVILEFLEARRLKEFPDTVIQKPRVRIPYTQKTTLPKFVNPKDLGAEDIDTLPLAKIYEGIQKINHNKMTSFMYATQDLKVGDPKARFEKLNELAQLSRRSDQFGKRVDNPLEVPLDPIPGKPLKVVPVEERDAPFNMLGVTVAPKSGYSERAKSIVLNLRKPVDVNGVTMAPPQPLLTTFDAIVSPEVLERFNEVNRILKEVLQRDDPVLLHRMSPDYAGYLDDATTFRNYTDYLPNVPHPMSSRLFIYYLDPTNPDLINTRELIRSGEPFDPKLGETAKNINQFFRDNADGAQFNLYYEIEFKMLMTWLQTVLDIPSK